MFGQYLFLLLFLPGHLSKISNLKCRIVYQYFLPSFFSTLRVTGDRALRVPDKMAPLLSPSESRRTREGEIVAEVLDREVTSRKSYSYQRRGDDQGEVQRRGDGHGQPQDL